MGQAKKRGSREERIQEAQTRSLTDPRNAINLRPVRLPSSQEEFLQYQANVMRLVDNLTTPTDLNEQVTQFTSRLSEQAPIFLQCEPELWSRQSCCEANVERYCETNPGRAIYGYRIWYSEPYYIEGERHAVWTDGTTIKDVSFADSGESRILFVPDELEYDARPRKIRFAFNDSDKLTVRQMDESERRGLNEMSPEEAWNTMPSYEQWLDGRRMPNLIPTVRES